METSIMKTEGALSARDLRLRVNLIQEVMGQLMKKDVHYGQIPGCPKPSLWKPGAELISATFQIAVKSNAEDISGPDEKRYRVICVAYSKNGDELGSSIGECSSNEEKYKWRKPVCDEEWEEAPIDRKREKWTKDGSKIKQIRTEPADLANTILQMADKRAYVAVVRKVTAASDIFTQDIEDVDPLPMDAGESASAPARPKPKKEALKQHDFKAIKAKFDGKCKACDGVTRAGTDILYSKQLGVYHPGCLNPTKEELSVETAKMTPAILSNVEKMADAAKINLLDRIGRDGLDNKEQITFEYAQELLQEFAAIIDEAQE